METKSNFVPILLNISLISSIITAKFIFGGYETVQMTEPGGPELPLGGGGGRVRGGDGGRGGLLLHQSSGRGRAQSATSHSVPTSPAPRQQGIK